MNTLESRTLAVAFIDICGSTRLFAEHGNEAALKMTSRCLEIMRACVTEHQGRTVQTLGDGILCVFPNAVSAFRAAETLGRNRPQRGLAIHAGFDIGGVIEKDNSVFGDAVNVASRLSDLAKEEEFVFSENLFAQLGEHQRANLRLLGDIPLKGKAEPLDLYLLITEQQDLTYIPSQSLIGRHIPVIKAVGQLRLEYRGRSITLDDTMEKFVLGRHEDCNLQVNHNYASRRHAVIEAHQSRFYLSDQSTNGCFIVDDKLELVVLKRDSLQLTGTGRLSLGVAPGANPEHVIVYTVQPAGEPPQTA